MIKKETLPKNSNSANKKQYHWNLTCALLAHYYVSSLCIIYYKLLYRSRLFVHCLSNVQTTLLFTVGRLRVINVFERAFKLKGNYFHQWNENNKHNISTMKIIFFSMSEKNIWLMWILFMIKVIDRKMFLVIKQFF